MISDTPRHINMVEINLITKLLRVHSDLPQIRMWLIRKVISRDIATLADMTLPEYETIEKQAFIDSAHNDYRTNPAWDRRLADLCDEYRETVLHQLRLFPLE